MFWNNLALRTKNWGVILIICALSLYFCAHLLVTPGKPRDYDSTTHITTMAQYEDSLRQGEFPVDWTNNYATYGFPLGVIAHQVPAYAGALLTLVTKDPLLSYKLLTFLITLLTGVFIFFYLELVSSRRIYSLIGTALYLFHPYRIEAVYIRGALPEYMAMMWVALILFSIRTIRDHLSLGLGMLLLSGTGLLLTHPIMTLTHLWIIAPELILLIYHFSKKRNQVVIQIGAIGVFALLLSAWYLVPLKYEMKYFWYGAGGGNHYASGHVIPLSGYFNEAWLLECPDRKSVPVRCAMKSPGFVEMLILIGAIVTVFRAYWRDRKSHTYSLHTKTSMMSLTIWSVSALSILLITNEYTEFLFLRINILSQVQHGWRFLGAFGFIAPVLYIFLVGRYPKLAPYLSLCIVIYIGIVRFPQVYGNDYRSKPLIEWYQTRENYHIVDMNMNWIGRQIDYPKRIVPSAVIEGKGEISVIKNSNSHREYRVDAKTDMNLLDFTFYYPGWMVYVDNVSVPIQYQDPAYRGMITYRIPKGTHKVNIDFTSTKVRSYSRWVSITTLIALFIYMLFQYHRKRI